MSDVKADNIMREMPAAVSGLKRLRQLESIIIENGASSVLLSTGNNDEKCTNASLVHPGKTLSVEALLDALIVLYDECCNSSLRREKTVNDFIELVKPVIQLIKNLRLSRDDFEVLKVIGRGAFGEVCVVRMTSTNQVFAMKILNKWEMLKRAETACFREERDVLVYGDKQWITNLHYAFQDETNLYLVMDYYCGGDLLTLLSKFEDRLPEDMARFYITEMVLAIASIHRLRYVHRDIKPDNLVLDVSGHIRLADFGSCLKLGANGTVQSNVAVGTPDYISPEILRAMEDGQGRYGPECDWWSLGVCMYEMLYGETPFYAESLVETYGKIMNHKNCFDFPADDGSDYQVSENAKDLMRRLICPPEFRLGQNGIDDFKSHAWFEGVDWENIRSGQAPYIPEVSSPTDTSNFDVDDNDVRLSDAVPPAANPAFSGLHLPFIGFTFTQSSCLSDVGKITRTNEIQNNDLQNESDAVDNNIDIHSSSEALQHYKEQIDALTERNRELDSKVKVLELNESQLKAVSNAAADAQANGQLEAKIMELEKLVRQLNTEKEELARDRSDSHDRLSLQDKELNDALSQRKIAMAEYAEVTDKLSELRTQKQKLSRQVRDKEEELENAMHKIDTLRNDMRKMEKSRREYESRIEDVIAEATKERKLRERSEEYCRQLQMEVRSRTTSDLGSSSSLGMSSDSSRMEVERLEVQFSEKLNQQQARYNIELTALRDQLLEAETQRDMMQREMQQLRERLDSSRIESITDSEETISELRKRHEREMKILLDDNRKLINELDVVSETNRRMQAERMQIENDYEELRSKRQAIHQWERQISEVVQWISDDNDARAYLQALAAKMSEELDYIKHSGSLHQHTSDKNWRNRRSQKLDKMELLNLQSSLQSEIQAKAAISEELSRTRADLMAAQKDLRETRQRFDSVGSEIKRKDNQIRELQQRLELNEGSHISGRSTMNAWLSKTTNVLERPSSQMSYLDHFLKESGSTTNTTHTTSSTIAINMLPSSNSISQPFQGNLQNQSSTSSSSNNIHSQHYQSQTQVYANQQTPQAQQKMAQPQTPQQHANTNPFTQPQMMLHRSGYSMESEEGDIEDNPVHSLSSSKSNLSENSLDQHSVHSTMIQKPKMHQFLVRTFSSPTKCNHCTSLMVGLTRQGVVCELCGFACHTICCQKVPTTCPVPSDQTKRPLGIDPTRGIGTAYEGYVKVPKMGAVKRGWVRQFVVVCDFKLFLYDITADRSALPSVHVSQVLDMRDPEFAVTGVRESDVIHAAKKDVPCIFRITTSLIDGGLPSHTLMLADTESEKAKWVVALSELHRILKRNNLPNTAIFRVREVLDSSLSVLRGAQSALIIDPDRILLGTEDGLFCLDLDRSEMARIGESKKIIQLWHIVEEQILVVLCGKQRHVRLLPIRALEATDVEWIKVIDSKNCITACIGIIRRNPQPVYCICIALKRPNNQTQIIVYEVNRNRTRHHKMCEFTVAYPVQSLQILSDMRLAVGHQSGFTAYFLQGEAQAMSLVHPENQLCAFLNYSGVDAWRVIEIPGHGEFLLVFQTLAIYVDLQGRKSRDREIMYPALPTHITYCDGHLLVFSETHLDIFNTQTADWVQSIGLKRSRPLANHGNVAVTYINDQAMVIYLANMHTRELINTHGDREGRVKPKRRFSLRETNNRPARTTDRRSKLISAPTNFNHISHMGPGDGIQKQRLLDLPTTIETADQTNQRVSTSMRHAPAPPRQAQRPILPPYNGAKRAAPQRPREQPPSLPDHHLGRSPSPLGSMSSLHDVLKVVDMQSTGGSRHSVASNSSSVSSPPSPLNDRLSSSYDS
ncbi:serine/threonine-protein kinase Genghis Khan isoform X1 [Sitodiplosis mosellana]|uniref:serine/threonine-protein kinase Genghis Khan isoform X1 n=1 Tax=Sitodiplosis mosellana TaxID=263140 RepID=UPI0024449991|nr:serine/threonine-protein kinase Genghis Khan isoform X1 [Sitodiplosis mosellana]XP_055318571.1 serine/threonine-protein kinase Genghis Khan isoform X1 [Sitodiplosis mosellana]XP_055318573.1 serine/threonine-protein kinase Genghis Khan isoform X1 [Sitodiplosis mosellana]XP_055318574.1 serine/threonine-protein kinase Genghis Khan isoform X1 [Sitodiplosis mosellana]XP_055318575.1 serine/threonine-protein kinase Genghis Khan isoform X1 [Sitodiplosis mosellana]XP_055318576.1 serine/threonine-pro